MNFATRGKFLNITRWVLTHNKIFNHYTLSYSSSSFFILCPLRLLNSFFLTFFRHNICHVLPNKLNNIWGKRVKRIIYVTIIIISHNAMNIINLKVSLKRCIETNDSERRIDCQNSLIDSNLKRQIKFSLKNICVYKTTWNCSFFSLFLNVHREERVRPPNSFHAFFFLFIFIL